MSGHLAQLEDESVYIIREAFANTRNLSMLWSMGKDSTVMLELVRKAFFGAVPINLIHIDTTFKIPEMITWRDEFVKRHNLRLLVGKNEEALAAGMNASMGRLKCCGSLKTDALLETIKEHDVHGLLVGIRRDEEGSRGKERVVSPRLPNGGWGYKEQPAEIWKYYNLHLAGEVHLRVHPLLHWTEIDIWEYIRQEKLEILPLYYAKDGKRYRSLGCWPCTGQIDSTATTIDEIIEELRQTKMGERAGRAQDQVDAYAMQQLRSAGYM